MMTASDLATTSRQLPGQRKAAAHRTAASRIRAASGTMCSALKKPTSLFSSAPDAFRLEPLSRSGRRGLVLRTDRALEPLNLRRYPVRGDLLLLEDRRGRSVGLRNQPNEEMPGADAPVLHVAGEAEGGLDHPLGARRRNQPLDRRFFRRGLEPGLYHRGVDPKTGQYRGRKSRLDPEQAQ